MRIFYDLIFLLYSFFYLPVYLLKRKFHPGFSSRLGILPEGLKLNRPIWIHAVSVGEAMAIRALAGQLKSAFPGKQLVISTVTPTGNKIAKNIVGEGDFVTYLPLDFSFIVKKVIDRIDPCAFIIAETEIWPNLISYLNKKNIPVIIVNGRISDSSFKGYLSIRFLIKDILKKVSLFCVQTERDAKRFNSLGLPLEKINVTGNMKFDVPELEENKISGQRELKTKLGLKNEERVFIAASTHQGEDELVLRAYSRLLEDFPGLNLIIAPRHPERSREVARVAAKFMFCSKFISRPHEAPACATKPIFVLDMIGQLAGFYAIADIVFVGGSLVKKGGHNILEPASLAKPVIFGPHMFNFRDIAGLFLSQGAGILVRGEKELAARAKHLLDDPLKAAELGLRAKGLIKQNQGAAARNIGLMRKFIV